MLTSSDAWQRLPEVEEGGSAQLPVWARVLAISLPRTTAAMLELDWRHRADSPLDPRLRGVMRWTVARANRCDYAMAYAIADLQRAGLEQSEIEALNDHNVKRPESEQAALEFARKLTLAADTVTDDEVARLIAAYGEKQVVAMVLLVAHANFQDRLLLSMGLTAEPDGPLPPLNARFAKDQSRKTVAAAERKQPVEQSGENSPSETFQVDDADWIGVDVARLQAALEAQRDRPGRIRVPTWDVVREWLPERVRRNDPLRIKWSLVCLGYQPELALAWSACTRAFAEEAKQDRVFEESLFWVITRTIHCFY
jgi:alkylhydroperoxidase family enzyme